MNEADGDDDTPRQGGAPRPDKPRRNALIPPTPEEVAQRREEEAGLHDAIRARIKHAYTLAVLVFGKAEADREWKAASKKPQGRPKGSTKPEQDQAMLGLYDALVDRAAPSEIKGLAGGVGQFLAKNFPGEYGTSADSITRKLQRLLDGREKLRRKRFEEAVASGNYLLFGLHDK